MGKDRRDKGVITILYRLQQMIRQPQATHISEAELQRAATSAPHEPLSINVTSRSSFLWRPTDAQVFVMRIAMFRHGIFTQLLRSSRLAHL